MPLPDAAIRNILLIDDDQDDSQLFEEAVKQVDPGIQVSFINSVNDVPGNDDYVLPDLLFLDINMPDRSGFEWLQCIRQKGYSLPVIMYSTASNPDYVRRAYTEGATVYFPKPESYKTLKDSLHYLLQLNWQEPGKITEGFCHNGQYQVFSLAAK